MTIERKYAFRKFLNTVHLANRRDESVVPRENEVEIASGWSLIVPENVSKVVMNVAKDLQDYLFTSMNVSIMLRKASDVAKIAENERNVIVLGTKTQLARDAEGLKVPRSYRLVVGEDCVRVCGEDDRGVAQGCYYIEDLMNLREAPILEEGEREREPLFSPRMVHSGWGLDQYPNAHLNAIAHAGMDAILVFVKDVDTTPMGYLDFNDLIDRAADYGIDVYFYSYLRSMKHPADRDAMDYYDSTYGRLFKNCPGAKGVVLVGESCEFPSRDVSNTSGKCRWETIDDGLRPVKPTPGWWPCEDYPEWLKLIKKTIGKYRADADIVFWTYNWGYAPEKDRIALIDSLPNDITLLVTFEMFEQFKIGEATAACMDYTISLTGPGKYFISEAKAAKRKNIKLYAMSNTAGMTWDFGTIPYIPVPCQWRKRHEALIEARGNWGLSGLMEGHHYGFFPSFISDLAKWSYWTPGKPAEEILASLAKRDFGERGAPEAVMAWKSWSASMEYFISSNEDQYGPFRVGPSYPLIFHPDITRTFSPQEILMPASPHAYLGNQIVKTFYGPFENAQQSPGAIRYPEEIKSLERMMALWEEGIELMRKVVAKTQAGKKDAAIRMLGLGQYILNSVRTAVHLKKWWLLNKKLQLENVPSGAREILNQLVMIAEDEIRNAKETIPLVEADSRLGWEPSMEYMTDREHLEWKIRQVESVLNYDIPTYRRMLDL